MNTHNKSYLGPPSLVTPWRELKNAEGNMCLVYENINQLNTHLSNNGKVEKMKEIHDELEINIAAYCKHKVNFKHKRNVNRFNQLFKGMKPQSSLLRHIQCMRMLEGSSREG